MYLKEKLGDNAIKFSYTKDVHRSQPGKTRGVWKEATLAIAAASLIVQQSHADERSALLGAIGIAAFFGCVGWFIIRRSQVREESLLVIRGLGVQIATMYTSGREEKTFLDEAKIKAVFINEGITMYRIIFYLAFVVRGRDNMVVAFSNLKPRLEVLADVYRTICKAILEDPQDLPKEHGHDARVEQDTAASLAPSDRAPCARSVEDDERIREAHSLTQQTSLSLHSLDGT